MRIPISVAFATLIVAAPAAALDMPARKPGLWQLTMNFESRGNLPGQVMKHCIDAETDRLMNSPSASMGREQCSKQEVQRLGSTIVIDSVCTFGNVTNVSHAVVSGDFNSAYTVEVDSKRNGGPQLPGGAMKMKISAQYLGACEPGQKPGDMIINGMTMNIHTLQQMRSSVPPGGMQGMSGRAGVPAR